MIQKDVGEIDLINDKRMKKNLFCNGENYKLTKDARHIENYLVEKRKSVTK